MDEFVLVDKNKFEEAHIKSLAWDEYKNRTEMIVNELPRDFQNNNREIEEHKKTLFIMEQCYGAVKSALNNYESEAE